MSADLSELLRLRPPCQVDPPCKAKGRENTRPVTIMKRGWRKPETAYLCDTHRPQFIRRARLGGCMVEEGA